MYICTKLLLLQLICVAATVETIQLLSSAIRTNLALDVLQRLADLVDALETSTGNNAYRFIFKCYMQVLNSEMIQQAEISSYPVLIEHILRAPRIGNPDILLSAMPNLKILLRPTGVRSKARIERFVLESLNVAKRK